MSSAVFRRGRGEVQHRPNRGHVVDERLLRNRLENFVSECQLRISRKFDEKVFARIMKYEEKLF